MSAEEQNDHGYGLDFGRSAAGGADGPSTAPSTGPADGTAGSAGVGGAADGPAPGPADGPAPGPACGPPGMPLSGSGGTGGQGGAGGRTGSGIPAGGSAVGGPAIPGQVPDQGGIRGGRESLAGPVSARVPGQAPAGRGGVIPEAFVAGHPATRPARATVPAPADPVDGERPPSDAELTALVRAGDEAAYEEIYRRHAESVRRYARTCCRDSFTAEDLAGEVFARTLQALKAGKGPEFAVRAYLLTAVRNVAAAWSRSERREQLVDDFTSFAHGSAAVLDPDLADPGADAWAMALADQRMVMRAFVELPEEDRLVLWHTEVEREAPKTVAVLIGKTANATAVQAHRARDRLAAAFLQAHVSGSQEQGCAAYANRLGAYARGSLRKRAAGEVGSHLRECDRCTAAYLELADINTGLRALLPGGVLVWAGLGGFSAAAAAVGAGAAVGGVAAGTAAVTAGGGAGGGVAGGSAAGGAAAGGGAGAGGAGMGVVAGEGLGIAAKAGLAAAAAVAAAGVAAYALAGPPATTPMPAAAPVVSAPAVPSSPPAAAPAAAAPTPTPMPPPSATPEPKPAPPAVTATPSRAVPARPAPSPARTRAPQPGPTSTPAPVVAPPTPTAAVPTPPAPSVPPPPTPEVPKPSASPPVVTPTPTVPPAPTPTDFWVDNLPFSPPGPGRVPATGPSIRRGGDWLWQRGSLRVGGRHYRHGVTMRAPSATTIDLNRSCTSFDAVAGLDDLALQLGDLVFSVQGGDGRTLWTSPELHSGDAPVPVHVPLAGQRSIRLVVTPVSGAWPIVNAADWADARLRCV
ncbi:sigma-70 family RNA polymerase sigma factor [Kitasatospora sp. NPDC050543]|uniref:sigma-70 family RNA polymerase sigma factor n=1 Tax=Kitasatospora sp. NPDC050543 TaxID=3364054 RepID=UPI0037937252